MTQEGNQLSGRYSLKVRVREDSKNNKQICKTNSVNVTNVKVFFPEYKIDKKKR